MIRQEMLCNDVPVVVMHQEADKQKRVVCRITVMQRCCCVKPDGNPSY